MAPWFVSLYVFLHRLWIVAAVFTIDFLIRVIHIFVHPAERVSASAIISFGVVLAFVFGAEYVKLQDDSPVEFLIRWIRKKLIPLTICFVLVTAWLEIRPEALYYGFGDGPLYFMTASPYLLAAERQEEIEEYTGKALDAEYIGEKEDGNPDRSEEEEEQWNDEKYRAFFHCDQIADGTLESYWRAFIDSRVGMEQPSLYNPDELSSEETNAISAIAEREPFNRTVDDWKVQCTAHEDYQEQYSSATFAYYLSNDYHNLQECGRNAGASQSNLLLWCSNAVEYRLDYLSYREAAGVRDVIRWIGKRYEEIAIDENRFGSTTSGYARENADVLLALAEEF